MATRSRSGRRNSGKGIGCFVWLALLIIVALLFVFNWERINKVMEETGFRDLLKDRVRPSASPSVSPRESPGPTSVVVVNTTHTARPSSAPLPSKEPSTRPSPSPSPAVGRSPSPKASSAALKPSPRTRMASLCFVKVDDDGTIVMKEMKRSLLASDSPLTDALQALMGGPNQDELAKGCISLIPEGSKVLSVVMRGTTAMVNMNEAFMFNSLGVDGYMGQLKQVVWTSTAFPTVHDVQFLIEGKKLDYLGGDSVFIGLPLARNSW